MSVVAVATEKRKRKSKEERWEENPKNENKEEKPQRHLQDKKGKKECFTNDYKRTCAKATTNLNRWSFAEAKETFSLSLFHFLKFFDLILSDKILNCTN